MIIKKPNGFIKYSISDMDDNELIIDHVETYERGKGTASELINEVIEIARKENKILSLCAYPQDDSIDLDTLISIYEHLGFVEEDNDGNSAIMFYEF